MISFMSMLFTRIQKSSRRLSLCTLYSDLCSGLYGAPRVLQSIANENVIPAIKFLGKGVCFACGADIRHIVLLVEWKPARALWQHNPCDQNVCVRSRDQLISSMGQNDCNLFFNRKSFWRFRNNFFEHWGGHLPCYPPDCEPACMRTHSCFFYAKTWFVACSAQKRLSCFSIYQFSLSFFLATLLLYVCMFRCTTHQFGPNKTPVLAICAVGFISLLFIFIGNLNAISPVITCNFMLVYASVDYAYFALAMSYDLNIKNFSKYKVVWCDALFVFKRRHGSEPLSQLPLVFVFFVHARSLFDFDTSCCFQECCCYGSDAHHQFSTLFDLRPISLTLFCRSPICHVNNQSGFCALLWMLKNLCVQTTRTVCFRVVQRKSNSSVLSSVVIQ